jgi:hypothetical protein
MKKISLRRSNAVRSMLKWESRLSSAKLWLGILCLPLSAAGIYLGFLEGPAVVSLATFGVVLIGNTAREASIRF